MASTTSDRPTKARPSNGCPRIDESVFAAIGASPVPVSTAKFLRWFACFATGGRDQ